MDSGMNLGVCRKDFEVFEGVVVDILNSQDVKKNKMRVFWDFQQLGFNE